MSNALTRRAAMTALAVGTAVALIPTAATAAPAGDTLRPDFLAAEQLFRRLEAESAAHDREVYEPARDRFNAAAAAVPHTAFDVVGVTWTTASEDQVKVARHVIGIVKRERPYRDTPEIRDMRRLVAAHLRRERTISRLPEKAIQQALYAQGERLTDASIAAEDAFYAMRPVSLAELAHKLRVIAERQSDYEGCVERIILPDVLALTTREG